METYNSNDALTQLLLYKIGDETKQYLNDVLKINHPDEVIYRDIISADRDPDIMRQVIGKSGHYFKLTTQNFNLEFIWYNIGKNTIEFWGYNEEDIGKARDIIEMRIKIIHNRMNARETETIS